MDTLKRYFWVWNMLVAMACMFFLGKGVTSLVSARVLKSTPYSIYAYPHVPEPTIVVKVDVEAISERNIFCSTCKPKEEEAELPWEKQPGQKTSLALEFIFPLFLDSPDEEAQKAFNIAVIKNSIDPEAVSVKGYHRRDEIAPKVYMVYVAMEEEKPGEDPKPRVYLLNDGKKEYLDYSATKGTPAPMVKFERVAVGGDAALQQEAETGIQCTGSGGKNSLPSSTGDNCRITRVLYNKLLGDTGAILRSANMTPNMKIIQPGFILAKLGLKAGDTLKSVNGQLIDTFEKGLAAFVSLKNNAGNTFALQVERAGKPVVYQYQID